MVAERARRSEAAGGMLPCCEPAGAGDGCTRTAGMILDGGSVAEGLALAWAVMRHAHTEHV